MQFKALLVFVPLATALSAIAAPAADHHGDGEDHSTLTVTDFIPTNIGLAPGSAGTGAANVTSNVVSASASPSAVATDDLAKRQLGVLTSILGEATSVFGSIVVNATSVLDAATETGLAKRQDESGILGGNIPTGILSSVIGEATSAVGGVVANATSVLGGSTATGIAKRAADLDNARMTWYDIQTGNQYVPYRA